MVTILDEIRNNTDKEERDAILENMPEIYRFRIKSNKESLDLKITYTKPDYSTGLIRTKSINDYFKDNIGVKRYFLGDDIVKNINLSIKADSISEYDENYIRNFLPKRDTAHKLGEVKEFLCMTKIDKADETFSQIEKKVIVRFYPFFTSRYSVIELLYTPDIVDNTTCLYLKYDYISDSVYYKKECEEKRKRSNKNIEWIDTDDESDNGVSNTSDSNNGKPYNAKVRYYSIKKINSKEAMLTLSIETKHGDTYTKEIHLLNNPTIILSYPDIDNSISKIESIMNCKVDYAFMQTVVIGYDDKGNSIFARQSTTGANHSLLHVGGYESLLIDKQVEKRILVSDIQPYDDNYLADSRLVLVTINDPDNIVEVIFNLSRYSSLLVNKTTPNGFAVSYKFALKDNTLYSKLSDLYNDIVASLMSYPSNDTEALRLFKSTNGELISFNVLSKQLVSSTENDIKGLPFSRYGIVYKNNEATIKYYTYGVVYDRTVNDTVPEIKRYSTHVFHNNFYNDSGSFITLMVYDENDINIGCLKFDYEDNVHIDETINNIKSKLDSQLKKGSIIAANATEDDDITLGFNISEDNGDGHIMIFYNGDDKYNYICRKFGSYTFPLFKYKPEGRE